jgi:glycolate oxidase iron-sulfur subunit
MEEKISKCNKCGFCQEVCPTYLITKNEANVARGRIRLAHLVCDGSYKWGSEPEIEEHIKSCLLCKACITNCPSSVATDKIIMEARERINAAKGFSFFHKAAYRGVLAEQKRFKAASGLARFYQHSGARRLLRGSKILGVAQKIKRMEDLLPSLPEKSFFQQAPGLIKNIDNPKFKVGYYVGCATNAFFSQVAVATVKVLQHYNCQIYAPEVECCGGPHQSAGDFDEGRRLAKDTIDKFSDKGLEYIVIDCATCGSTLKEYGELLKDDEEYSKKAQEVSNKVIDVNKFVLEHLEIDAKELKNVDYRVSYHDPCHGVRGLKVSSEPRELLKLIPGVEFIEMKQASMCCGGAGSYCFLQDDNSEAILKMKMERFRETEANILATSCPACMMQLGHGLRSRKIKADILHPMELLDKALNGH